MEVTVVWTEDNCICYMTFKILLEFLDHIIPYVRRKGDNMWLILSVGRHRFPSNDARKVRDDSSLKMVRIKY